MSPERSRKLNLKIATVGDASSARPQEFLFGRRVVERRVIDLSQQIPFFAVLWVQFYRFFEIDNCCTLLALREFRDLDDTVELGTRNIKLALRRLRRFARQGAPTELDIPATIRTTANNAGYLDLQMVPERHNTVKVLLFLDIGGSMDEHVRVCEELFSAARGEFKHLEYFYFHNCIYERVWKTNRRRNDNMTPTEEVMRKYGPDYKAIFVGDASMSPYEVSHPGGSVEHWNEEPGAVWLQRLTSHFRRHAWLNPRPRNAWDHAMSISMIRKSIENRMFPLTLGGIDEMAKELNR